MGQTIEPQSQLGRAWALLMDLIPAKRRARALELMLVLQADYATGECQADRHGYDRGHTDGQEASGQSAQRGYREGWEQGYEAAVKQVLGRVAVPQPHDDLEAMFFPGPPTTH